MKFVKKQFMLYRLSRIYRSGLKFWSWCALMAALVLFANGIFDPKRTYYLFFNFAALVLLLTGLAGFLLHCIARYEKRRVTAREFDGQAGTFNHFETFLEMEHSEHPLKNEHAVESHNLFKNFKLPFQTFLVLLLVLAALFFTGLDVGLMHRNRELNRIHKELEKEQAKAEKEKQAEEEKQKELAAETANLIVTIPEEKELRAKPLDELDWEGIGESPHGFTELALTVYINAEFRSHIQPEKLPGENGRIRFGSFLTLEDFEVKPFDLVSYHLTGQAMVGGEKRTILSEPGFIEVRPFREDVYTGEADQLTEGGAELMQILSAFLNRQIQLNKALFALKIYQLNPDKRNPIDTVKVNENIITQQQELAYNLITFLQDPKFRTTPADIINHLELAHGDMSNSVSAMLEPSLDKGLQHQQKAIANLIQAMKNIRKLLIKGPPPPPGALKADENPFKDKQKFKPPEIDPAKNPHNQLKDLVEEQKKLNDEIKKDEQAADRKTQDELADTQDKLQNRTNQLKADQPQAPELQQKLEQSAESMAETTDNLRANKNATASLKGQKAAANLESAMKMVEKASDEATRAAMDEARDKLDKLDKELQAEQATPEQAGSQLSDMAGGMGDKAEKQGQGGTMGNAGKLGKLGERLAQGAESKGSREKMLEELKEIKNLINEMRMNGQDLAQFLESAAGKLNEQSRQLKYADKNPGEIPPDEAAEVIEEMKKLLEDVSQALDQLSEAASKPELKKNIDTARARSRAAVSTVSREGEGRGATSNYKEISENTSHVVSLIAGLLVELKRDMRVYIFNAGDVPPKYRKATAEYFERLSNPEPQKGK